MDLKFHQCLVKLFLVINFCFLFEYISIIKRRGNHDYGTHFIAHLGMSGSFASAKNNQRHYLLYVLYLKIKIKSIEIVISLDFGVIYVLYVH